MTITQLLRTALCLAALLASPASAVRTVRLRRTGADVGEKAAAAAKLHADAVASVTKRSYSVLRSDLSNTDGSTALVHTGHAISAQGTQGVKTLGACGTATFPLPVGALTVGAKVEFKLISSADNSVSGQIAIGATYSLGFLSVFVQGSVEVEIKVPVTTVTDIPKTVASLVAEKLLVKYLGDEKKVFKPALIRRMATERQKFLTLFQAVHEQQHADKAFAGTLSAVTTAMQRATDANDGSMSSARQRWRRGIRQVVANKNEMLMDIYGLQTEYTRAFIQVVATVHSRWVASVGTKVWSEPDDRRKEWEDWVVQTFRSFYVRGDPTTVEMLMGDWSQRAPHLHLNDWPSCGKFANRAAPFLKVTHEMQRHTLALMCYIARLGIGLEESEDSRLWGRQGHEVNFLPWLQKFFPEIMDPDADFGGLVASLKPQVPTGGDAPAPAEPFRRRRGLRDGANGLKVSSLFSTIVALDDFKAAIAATQDIQAASDQRGAEWASLKFVGAMGFAIGSESQDLCSGAATLSLSFGLQTSIKALISPSGFTWQDVQDAVSLNLQLGPVGVSYQKQLNGERAKKITVSLRLPSTEDINSQFMEVFSTYNDLAPNQLGITDASAWIKPICVKINSVMGGVEQRQESSQSATTKKQEDTTSLKKLTEFSVGSLQNSIIKAVDFDTSSLDDWMGNVANAYATRFALGAPSYSAGFDFAIENTAKAGKCSCTFVTEQKFSGDVGAAALEVYNGNSMEYNTNSINFARATVPTAPAAPPTTKLHRSQSAPNLLTSSQTDTDTGSSRPRSNTVSEPSSRLRSNTVSEPSSRF